MVSNEPVRQSRRTILRTIGVVVALLTGGAASVGATSDDDADSGDANPDEGWAWGTNGEDATPDDGWAWETDGGDASPDDGWAWKTDDEDATPDEGWAW